jgi:hypothetical protein
VEEEDFGNQKTIAKSQFLVPKADFYEKRERSQEGIRNEKTGIGDWGVGEQGLEGRSGELFHLLAV